MFDNQEVNHRMEEVEMDERNFHLMNCIDRDNIQLNAKNVVPRDH
jgi:hypothetical protein